MDLFKEVYELKREFDYQETVGVFNTVKFQGCWKCEKPAGDFNTVRFKFPREVECKETVGVLQ